MIILTFVATVINFIIPLVNIIYICDTIWNCKNVKLNFLKSVILLCFLLTAFLNSYILIILRNTNNSDYNITFEYDDGVNLLEHSDIFYEIFSSHDVPTDVTLTTIHYSHNEKSKAVELFLPVFCYVITFAAAKCLTKIKTTRITYICLFYHFTTVFFVNSFHLCLNMFNSSLFQFQFGDINSFRTFNMNVIHNILHLAFNLLCLILIYFFRKQKLLKNSQTLQAQIELVPKSVYILILLTILFGGYFVSQTSVYGPFTNIIVPSFLSFFVCFVSGFY